MAFVDWWVEPFALGFEQRALLGGILAGLMCSVVGTWLVLRGMSFFGDAFVHGVVPGIAAAVVLDLPPALGAALAAVVMVAGIELVNRQSLLGEDTAIGLLFVGMLALGVAIISSVDSYTGSLTSMLFGDALGVTQEDLVQQAILGLVVLLTSLVMYRPFLALAFNRQKAALLGMRPGLAHAVLLALIAAAVIGSFQAVGTLLVFGLLIGPPATAVLLVRTVPRMMMTASGISVVSVWLGLVLSYHLGTAASATMAMVPIVGFFMTLTWVRIRTRLRLRRRASHTPPPRWRRSAADTWPTEAEVEESGGALGRARAQDATAVHDATGGVVRGSDVVLRYDGHTAVTRATFTVPAGRITAVIGPNGSGKSTLLNAMAGLIPVAEGSLETLGQVPARARQEISYVLQSMVVPATTPMTVRETVAMGRYPSLGWFRRATPHDRERVRDAMRRLEITDLAGRHLHELSGGQRQRVYVAQGLVQDHRLLLLDEPLTGLDMVSARTIDRIIHDERASGGSIVLTTHDLEEARAADHVLLMSGRVVASGPPAAVCSPGNLAEAFGLGSVHGWHGFLDDPAHDPHGEQAVHHEHGTGPLTTPRDEVAAARRVRAVPRGADGTGRRSRVPLRLPRCNRHVDGGEMNQGCEGRGAGCGRRGRPVGGGAGLLDPAILASLGLVPAHGYDLRSSIEELTGGFLSVDPGGLYRALRRLEEDGLVESAWAQGDHGPQRRIYRLSADGREALAQWSDGLVARGRAIDGILRALSEAAPKA
ncbi:metal ABC transporter permease [Actinotalea subterranea]|uniref:metal ABC transporter permease n=1 Tax=Actinotalea subterranea TaxID=2607497 RepID=UPI0011EF427A|nr:metal ABC transporter permease [Actinotalea subterranea]